MSNLTAATERIITEYAIALNNYRRTADCIAEEGANLRYRCERRPRFSTGRLDGHAADLRRYATEAETLAGVLEQLIGDELKAEAVFRALHEATNALAVVDEALELV